MRSALAVLILILPLPAVATEYYCLAKAATNWNIDPSRTVVSTEDQHGFNGWFEFWVDTATGEWRGRNVGSAAMYSDGGTYTVANDGTGYRDHWVGVDAEAGRETLHLLPTRDPVTFARVTRDGFVETGTCLTTDGREFLDGKEIVR
jgi:hypothetical protein